MAQLALRWILMFDAVSCTIPSAKNRTQAAQNVQAADLPPLSAQTMADIRGIYEGHIRDLVHQRW
jgi:aryl-alcohol dehydrogenase-like predicted oxidoreductase